MGHHRHPLALLTLKWLLIFSRQIEIAIMNVNFCGLCVLAGGATIRMARREEC